MATVTLGIYEKALCVQSDWNIFFQQVADGGFSFVDLSVDETTERAARLDWDGQTRREVRQAAANAGVQIGGICLSLHRKIMPGSQNPQIRAQAAEVYRKGIDLCADLGVPVCQVAGYYCYYEDPHEKARQYYVEALAQAVPYAAQKGVILGIENVDGHDIAAIPQARELVDLINSPWLQIYPDIGNIAEHGGDEELELKSGEGHMVAIHIKDVFPGQPRRIPLGEGCVNWLKAFQEIMRQNWSGRMMLEMWNDDAPNSTELCIAARKKLTGWLNEAGIEVIAPDRK